MKGTNNLHANIEDIYFGVKEVVRQLKVKLPNTKIILLGVLPRADPLGTKVTGLNTLLAQLNDNKIVHYLDMWSAYMNGNGTQKTELFIGDKEHLNAAGYEVWAQTMDPLLKKLDV